MEINMIRIRNLHKFYGQGSNRAEVLKGLDLTIGDGDLVCLLGPSGSGKSTLLNILGGIETIDEGEVESSGQALHQAKPRELSLYRRKKVGFIFQFYNLVSNLNVRENIELGAYLAENALDVEGVIDMLGLTDQQYKYPRHISGGQAQRTSIGRAMVKNPSLLLCDEPTGALDYESAKGVLGMIAHLQKTFQPIIIIATHNSQIASMCDTIIHLHNGLIRSIGHNDHPVAAEEVVW